MKIRVQKLLREVRAYALILLASLVGVLFIATPSHAAAGINGQLNFQGRLLTPQGATVPDGYYNMQFKIYQDGDGQTAGNTTGSPAGSLKWTENHLNASSQGVTVKNGYLSVQLGSITAFGSSVDWNQDTLWLSINVAGTGASCTPFSSCSPDGEMLPMKRLSSTPYAMNAGQLGGLTSSQFIQSTTTPQTANIAVQSAAANSIGAQVLGAASQTADIFQVKANGVVTSLFAVSAAGAASLQNTTDSTTAFTVKNQNGRLVMGVDTSNGKVTLGNITSTSGAGVAGTLVLADGTNDNFGSTLASATLTANRTITLPDATGTVCLQTSATCGFLTAEADTLATVTSRGATTTTATTLQGGATIRGVTIDNSAANDDKITIAVTSGGVSSFTGTITAANLTAARTWTLPDASGTFCMQSSASCGFLTGAASDYIQNQNAAQQASSNFWISGTGRADVAMQAPLFDAATASALNIGTTNATGINLNQSTTIASGKNLLFKSGSFAATFSSTSLTANRAITVPDAAGTLAVSASGNIALSAAGDISFTGQLPVTNGGTGSNTASGARSNLGAAASGANSDITSLTGLTTALSIGQGGTGATTSQAAIDNISQLTTNGDLLYYNGSNSTRLARGANGECLGSTAATIQWTTCLTAEADTLASVTGRGATTSTAVLLQGGATIRGATIDSSTAANDKIALSITTGGSNSFTGTITNADLTANRTYTLPDATGTLAVSASGNIALSSAGDITFSGQLPVANGGTGSATASGARTNLGAAASGSNSDITALSGLTTALSISQGGTGATSTQNAIDNLSQLTTNGDLLYFNGTNSTRLARGSNGQCMLSNATTILWGTCVTSEADTLASVTGRGATTSTAVLLQGGATVRGLTVDTATATDDKIAISVTTGGVSSFTGTFTNADLTGARTWTLPDATGTICLQTSTNCGFLSSSTGVTLQSTTPGSAQGGNFNITGTGIVGTLTVTGSSGTSNINLGSASTNTGQLTFLNSSNANTAIIQGGVTTTSFTTVLPTAIGTTGQCLGVGSTSGSTQNLDYVGCLTTANSVELQASTPGTAQTGHFNISGTGIVGTMQTSLVTGADDTAITVRGGNATVSNTNGATLTVTGGAGNGTGVTGLVALGPTAYNAVVNSTCSSNCTIALANVNSYGTVVVNASTAGIIMTLPDPTITATKGRTIYITTASGSQDFTLRTNSGADLIDVAMRQNTTSTMIWNGTDWTPGGASNATTLQATYNNGSNPSTTPEIKLDSIRGTIDIQDADTTIGTDLFNIRGSNSGGLGTVLFGVSNTGRVTVQDTSDTSSSFRVLNSSGNYLLNVNGYSNYTFNNTIRQVGNEIANPHFESGGAITSGEVGWFGPAQASIVNSSSNSHTGNYQLQIAANSSAIDVYGGSYYEINPSEEIYLEAWVKNSSGAAGNAGIRISWYDKDKNFISASSDNGSTPGTTYIRRSVNAAAPSNAIFARVSASLQSGTSGTFYFDDFYMKRSVETSPYVFRNAIDTTSAFQIQSAASSQTLFSADTTNNIVKIGDSTGTNTNTTILVVDSATADPTSSLSSRNGGLFYRSDTNSLKAIIGGAVVDICTTAVTCTGYSASAGASVQLQASTPGTQQTGNFNITGVGMLTQLQTMDQSTSSTNTSNLTIRTGNATGSSSNSGNLTLDVGTATGTLGTITIGHTNVATTMPGTLKIQGGSSLELGQSSTNTGQVLFRTSVGANTVTLKGPSANPTSSYTLTLPQNLGANGECIKTDTTGGLYFQGCGVGVNFNLQDAYNNSGTPATVTLADGKNLQFTAQDTTTDPSIVFDLQCPSSCSTNGVFKVTTTAGTVFTIKPNSQGIVLNAYTQIGDSTTDATQVNFQLDSYNGGTDSGTCSTTTNQGAMYYNTAMGSLRACLNGAWGDVSNPDTLGLLTFGIVPSSGSNPYDLPANITAGVSGPCKVSWASNTSVSIEPCTAYSNGRRFSVTSAVTLNTNSGTAPNINLSTTNRWGHICLDSSTGQPAFTTTAGQATALAGLPNFSVSQPILCLADVQGESVTAGRIDNIYDTRTFTSTMKEAVSASTAVELGMLTDSSGTNGSMVPGVNGSKKLYGLVVATNGGTSSTTPNAIVSTFGAGWVKATAGTAGQFVEAGVTTNGYADTIASVPNNAFYYTAGNTRTTWSTTCTAASNCSGSLYMNFIVR